jgi:hypothetical protein
MRLLLSQCGCHNFARRDICFRCNLPRTENAVAVSQQGDAFGDSVRKLLFLFVFLIVILMDCVFVM